VIAAVALALFITAFAIMMTIQSQRIAAERDHADRERRRAQQVSNVVMNVFALADPFQNFGTEVSASELLDQAARSITRELTDQPVPRARLLQAVGRAYVRRGEFRKSKEYLRDAVHVLSQLDGAANETLMAMIDLSAALRIGGDLDGAHSALVSADHLAKERGLDHSKAYARLILSRGRIEVIEGRTAQARADYEQSLRLYQQLASDQSIEVAEVLSELSELLTWSDDYSEAERAVRRSIALYEAKAPLMHPDRVASELRLAQVLFLQARFDESGALLSEALRRATQIFGHQSPHVVYALDMFAILRYTQRRLDEAERLSVEALDMSRVVFGERHALTASMTITLARTLIELHKYAEAEFHLRDALTTLAATLPADHQYTASAEYFLGETLLATNRPSEAEAVLTASMNRWKRSDSPAWRAMRSANALGEALCRQGRTTEGEKYLSDSLRELNADPKAEPAAKDKASARAKRYLHGFPLTSQSNQRTGQPAAATN
jgi:tetratricopeptide (TPR) repeat protein